MIRSLLGTFWIACAGLIVLLAVLLSLVRVLLPYADSYRDDIERGLAAHLGHEVSIGRVAAEWRGLGPRLMLRDLRVLAPEEAGGESRFERAEVELDVLRSLAGRTPYFRRMLIAGLHLTLVREADGTFDVAGWDVSPQAPGSGRPLARMPRWLLAQGRLAVEGAEIVLVDLMAPDGVREFRFTDVGLELRSARGRYQIDGRITPPEALGERLGFAIDVQVADDGLRGALLYLDGSGLRPASWLPDDLLGLRVSGGIAEGKAWFEWEGGELRRADGLISTSGLVIGARAGTETEVPEEDESREFTAESASARIAWRREGAGWRLLVDRILVSHGEDGPGEPRRLVLASGVDGAPPGGIGARMDALELGDALRLAALSARSPGFLVPVVEGVQPRGLLRDIDLGLWEEEGTPRFVLGARFEEVAGEHWRGAPGLTGITGTLRMDERSGSLDLSTGEGAADFDRLFRDTLPAARLHARVDWERTAAGWRVRSPGLAFRNEDLSLDAWGRLDWPAEGEPSVVLFADFEAFSIDRVSRYLPAGIMRTGTVGWLDGAILGGTVPRGELILHGPLRAFPYDGREGLFRVDFELRDGVLEYAPAWPRLEDIDARIVFEGRGMDIVAAGARTLSADISQTRVAIADLAGDPAVITVSGRASGPTADALYFLRETPLVERFGAYVEEISAAGTSELALELAIPLDSGAASVQGMLALEDSTLLLADGAVEVSHINGELGFSDDGVAARDVAARIWGLPALVHVETAGEGSQRITRIEASGTADAVAVAGLLRVSPTWLSGAADWQARLIVPPAGELRDAGMGLRIESGLAGMGIDLPEPLAKPAAETMPLRITARLPRAPGRAVSVAVGEGISLALGFDRAFGLDRGELRIGGGEAALPALPGLRVVGRADHFSWDEWKRVLSAGGTPDAGAAPRVRELDLEIGRARVAGRDFHDARLVAAAGESSWAVTVESREMAGKIDIPLREGPPWRAELAHLHLAAAQTNGDGEAAIDPRGLPAMRLTSERFSYDGSDFGSLRLSASPRPAGMHLDELSLSSGHMKVDARGDWVRVEDEQYSSFRIEFETENFGRALSSFGYADSVRGGRGHSKITARWVGPPTAFALDRLHGSMEMEITNGRLLDVEPGAGRVFGLISLQALPRRLTLDFSDFFGKGFSFDRLAGSFDVRDGIATTTDLAMAGPAARVEARGDIDLAGRQYDQTVVVTPSVGSGLPVAGVVAGGVGVGAAMLLMERVFKDNIERITRLHYRVRGPWHDPLVERLQDGVQSGKR